MVQAPQPPQFPTPGAAAPAAAPPPALSTMVPAPAAPPPFIGAVYAARALSDSGMPTELLQHLGELEEWAIANKNDARNDAIAFWSFKIPAILASAGAGLLAHFDLATVSLISGAVASACVIVDGVHPRGMLRNIHLRAHHDIRILSSSMVVQWRSRSSSTNDDDTARQIIRNAEKQRQGIAAYVRDADTALKSRV